MCYKVLIKGMKHWGISLATFSFPGHLGSTSLKRPLRGAQNRNRLGRAEESFLWSRVGRSLFL